jgi:D-glycero-alpha-D-manno-heptose-7-phosphate kinase
VLIVRAPVRISFCGGGTDLESYYKKYTGMVISTTIDRYFYVFLNVNHDDTIQITSSDYRTFYRHDPEEPYSWDGDLRLPQAVLDHFGINRGVSMFLASEVPPGTGLGSSSTVTVAIVKALSVACELSLSKGEIAELASYIEIEKLGMPIGKQDQYAASFGGFNLISFGDDEVTVTPLSIGPDTRESLRRNVLLFFTGTARSSATILAEHRKATEAEEPEVLAALHAVKRMVPQMKECLERGALRRFGELLHESWCQKRRFAAGVSTPFIDQCYLAAQRCGAVGGKIAGAGGGGFMMLYIEDPHVEAVTRTLEQMGVKRMDYHFERDGARVLLNTGLALRDRLNGETQKL